MNRIDRTLSYLLYSLVALVFAVGVFWAYWRGGNDFLVFYTAWSHVLAGNGPKAYTHTPDFFLYAPGFAWILSPLALWPFKWALGIWCFAKALALAYVLWTFSRFTRKPWIPALACLVVARPLLIDLQYGQVNFFILATAVWVLLGSKRYTVFRWLTLTFVAIAKLMLSPLFLIPFITKDWRSTEAQRMQWGVMGGLMITLLVPMLTEGIGGTFFLYEEWYRALDAKGTPLDTRNQSFAATLNQLFYNPKTEMLLAGPHYLDLRIGHLSKDSIVLMTLAWALIWAGMIWGWIASRTAQKNKVGVWVWASVLIGMLIVPAHLVWKPYFLMGLPVACVVLNDPRRWWFGVVAGVLINFTSFDFIGVKWAGWAEVFSVMLLVHIGLLAMAARSPNSRAQINS